MNSSFLLPRSGWLRNWFWLLLLVGLLSAVGGTELFAQQTEKPSESAASGTVVIESVSVGVNGVYKVGCWTPAEITASFSAAGSYALELVTVDSDGAPFSVRFDAAEVESSGQHMLEGKFLPGRMEADLRVRVYQQDELRAERSFPSSPFNPESIPVAEKTSLYLIGLVGPDTKAGADSTGDNSQVKGKSWPQNFIQSQQPSLRSEKPTRVIRIPSLGELSGDVDTLKTFDAIIISENFDIPAEAEQRLQRWVEAGGHLMVMVGDRVDEWQVGSLSKWMPLTISRLNNLKHLSDLENYVGKGRLARIIMDVARIEPDSVQGSVELASIEGPVVVKTAYGFGVITVSALDLSREPLASWESLPIFFEKIFNRAYENQSEGTTQGGKNLVHAGVSTLRTQLQGTLDQFESTRNLSAWEVMVRILGLIVLLGPLDYLLTHKVLRRPGLTWISFPLMLGIAVLLTLSRADAMHHESPLLRDVSLMDHDAASGLTRYRVWESYYSPESARANASILPGDSTTRDENDFVQPPRTTWSGTPEENFSGMYRPPGISFGLPTYELGLSESRLSGIPIGQWSSKVMEADWLVNDSDAPAFESNLTVSRGGRLTGTFSHHLPVPLEDWFIAFENQVYLHRAGNNDSELVPLPPGESFDPDGQQATMRSIKNYLTGRQGNERPDQQDVLAPTIRQYEVATTDPYRIFRAATFYDAVGGREYYTLSNETFSTLDLSPQLNMKRAVVYGIANLPVSKTIINDEPLEPVYQKTLIRALLPVK
ncbi:MAG: hypothetical protein CMJ46_08265 [Planctomyces sp.]|nr:hypothetical protein [Planctomyces sp.]